jgi:hypothetical protein
MLRASSKAAGASIGVLVSAWNIKPANRSASMSEAAISIRADGVVRLEATRRKGDTPGQRVGRQTHRSGAGAQDRSGDA